MDTTAPTDADVIALDRETFDWFAAMPGNVLRQDGPGASSVASGDGPGHIVFATRSARNVSPPTPART